MPQAADSEELLDLCLVQNRPSPLLLSIVVPRDAYFNAIAAVSLPRKNVGQLEFEASAMR
jgi:hypothetical protein